MKQHSRWLLVMAWLVTPVDAHQLITPAQTSLNVAPGASLVFTPVYSVTSPQDGTETGLGLRIHFNANAVQLTGVSNRFAYGLQPSGEITPDSENADGDPSTDSYLVLPWLDTTAQWPGKDVLPLPLANLSFTAKSGFSGTTTIRTTASATADGALLQSTPMTITVQAANPSSVSVQARAWLQGAYVSSMGMMRDSLRTAGVLPTAQPYQAWGHTGQESLAAAVLNTAGANAPVDWVLLELRSQFNPATRVASKAAIVQRDGDIVDAATGSTTLSFSGVSAGSYYLALHHRNHLGVMSKTPLNVSSTATLLDFTQSTTAMYGKDTRSTQGNTRLLVTGDVNADNKLIAEGPGNDKNSVLGKVLADPQNPAAHTNFQVAGYSAADLNLDAKTLFTGPDNDVNTLLGNILLAPENPDNNTNYILSGSVPR